jgi:hypothetical protein
LSSAIKENRREGAFWHLIIRMFVLKFVLEIYGKTAKKEGTTRSGLQNTTWQAKCISEAVVERAARERISVAQTEASGRACWGGNPEQQGLRRD